MSFQFSLKTASDSPVWTARGPLIPPPGCQYKWASFCFDRWWAKLSYKGMWYQAGHFFGFVGKHQCFKPDMSSYREPVDRIQQWYDMGELQEIEHKDQLQGFDGMQGKTSQECSATVQFLDDKRLHKHLSYLRRNRHDHVRVATWMDSDNWLYKTTPRFFALSEGVIQEFSKETKISWCGDSASGNEQPFTVRCCARHARHMCPRGKRNTEP